MSIENNLTRIADALEALVHKLDHIGCAVNDKPTVKKQEPVAPVGVQPAQVSTPAHVTPAAVTPPPPVSPPPAQPSPVVTPQPAAVTPPPPAPEQPAMTAVELNAALVEEYNRLGSRDPIVAAMKSMNAASINDLKPEQYAELLSKVRAL